MAPQATMHGSIRGPIHQFLLLNSCRCGYSGRKTEPAAPAACPTLTVMTMEMVPVPTATVMAVCTAFWPLEGEVAGMVSCRKTTMLPGLKKQERLSVSRLSAHSRSRIVCNVG